MRPSTRRPLRILGLAIAIWGVAVGLLSAGGVLGVHPGGLAISIFVSWGGAVTAFAIAYRRDDRVRALVLSVDLRIVVAFQFFRFAGLVFLVAYRDRILPAATSLVPGVLDLLVCYSALALVFYFLDRRPFPRRAFVTWNAIGIADFVITAVLFYLVIWNVLSPAESGWEGYRVVTGFPFGLISCFMVPLAIVMHLTAILQTCHQRWRSMAALVASQSTAPQPADGHR